MNPYAELAPSDLRQAAKDLIRPKDPGRHWTVLAAMIGTVEDRRAYVEWGFRSLRVWAESELDLGPEDTVESLRLWRLIQGSHLEIEAWAEVSKAKAKVLMRALAMGGDPATWIRKAMDAESADALREELQRYAGEEIWSDWCVAMPESVLELVDAAMMLALREIPDVEPSTDRQHLAVLIGKREVRFRLLEILAKSYIESAGRQSC